MTKEEAIKIIRDNWDKYQVLQKPLKELIPELRESEDERIRKKLIEAVGYFRSRGIDQQLCEEFLTYLEKQKEPKDELVYRLNGLMQDYIKEGKDDEEKEHRFKCYYLFWDALEDANFFEQKEQKPVEWDDGDERIRGKLVEYHSQQFEKNRNQKIGLFHKAALIYLEKQKEMENEKTNLSETVKLGLDRALEIVKKEDEDMRKAVINCIDQLHDCNGWEYVFVRNGNITKNIPIGDVKKWVESFVEPKQEWSEEDERMARFYENDYNNNLGNMPMRDVIENRIKFRDWLLNRLKYLRPSWKPSEKQMRALKVAFRKDGMTNIAT